MFTLLLVTCICILSSHNAIGKDFQLTRHSATEISNPIAFDNTHFLQKIRFTQRGMRCFIEHKYNHYKYADFLANNFFHFVQFLKRDSPQTRSYYQSVLRMFGNKLKQSMYINPYAYCQMLDEITPCLQKACSDEHTPIFKQLQTKISSTMYNAMLDKFDYLKIDPEAYFHDLSEDIISLVNTTQELPGDASIEELRKSFMVFFETTVSKLIWSPNQYEHAWRNVKIIGDQLARLYEKDILSDQDDLNDLFITLLERFCLYLDLSYAEIPVEFYQTVRQDIQTKNLLLLELEQEQFIETKAQRLERAITMTEAKTRAYHSGILVS